MNLSVQIPFLPSEISMEIGAEGEFEILFSNLPGCSREPIFDAGERGIMVNGRIWRYAYAQLRRSGAS